MIDINVKIYISCLRNVCSLFLLVLVAIFDTYREDISEGVKMMLYYEYKRA